jgi:hypothetical protein
MRAIAQGPRPVCVPGGIDFPPYLPPPSFDGMNAGVAECALRTFAQAIGATIRAGAPLDPWAEKHFLEAMVASRNGSFKLCRWQSPTMRNPYGSAVETASARCARQWVDAHY